jgi:hypothetical protein
MEHAKIVQKVRDILNEHGGDDELIIGTDRVLLENYIESAIPDAVIMLAQKGYRVNVKTLNNVDFEDDDVIKDNDFVSLILVRSAQWKKEVTKLTDMNSPEYVMAQNEFTRPGVHSPIVYWDGNCLYSIPGTGGMAVVVYNAKYNADNGITAEAKEATAVCYMTAALVLGMFGDDQGKQRLSDVATNMLQ